MRRLFLLLSLLVALTANAQQRLKFSVASFEMDPFDMTAKNEQYKKIDGNGSLYAIIKVTSSNPDDDLSAYRFNFGNMNHEVVQKENKLWVYVQRNAKYVTISRQGYATVERYDLQMTIEEGRTYVMQLSTAPTQILTQMVLFSVTPADSKATVMVKASAADAVEDVIGITDETGSTAKPLPFGTYSYRVVAEGFYPSEGHFTLNDVANTHPENVVLKPKFATVTLRTSVNADIYVNGERKGRSPWTGRLNGGSYQVECRLANHRPSTQAITIVENESRTIDLPAPTPITGLLSVMSQPLGAAITIDGQPQGTTPKQIPQILIGQHSITLSKDGYEKAVQTFDVTENQTTNLNLALKKIEKDKAAKNSSGAATGTESGHAWVDLGLSVCWATTNLGASSESDYGDYYAWGETSMKNAYIWSTYKYCNGSDSTMTKYCASSKYGTVDNKTQLDLTDDVAHVKWGGKWRMPTYKELGELNSKCTWTWTTRGGQNGYLVTGPNGNSIFLPAAGYRYDSNLYREGTHGGYWSSSLSTSNSSNVRSLYLNSSDHYMYNNYYRYIGQSIRPVVEP